MTWQTTPYTIPLVAAAAISASLLARTRRHSSTLGANPLTFVILGVTLWSLEYALQLSSADLATKIVWAKIKYLSIVIIPGAWLCLALQHTERERHLTRRNLILLAVHPVATLCLVWTNDLHSLIWRRVSLDTSGSFAIFVPTHGAGFWIHTAYSYLLLLLGSILLIRSLIFSPSPRRERAGALLIGALAPWMSNALVISGLNPLAHLDLTPFAFTITGVAMAYGLTRYPLLEILPVARDAIFESMGDAIAVLDVQGRIVDLNPAAEEIIGYSATEAMGRPASEIFADHTELIKRYGGGRESDTEITLRPGLGKKSTSKDSTQRFYDLRISSLVEQSGHRIGWVVVLRDISARKRAEEALHESHNQLEKRVLERTAELAEANQALQAEIAERGRVEKQLRISLREKEILLQEIHHRVKNNMQVISSLLNLQARRIENQAAIEIFQESQNRVRSMALVHQKLYQSQDLASIDFGEYIQNLASYLFRAYGVDPGLITLRVNADKISMGIDVAVPCGLIVNELISNSLKHAFPDGRAGEIQIALQANGNGKYVLLARDNGVGLPQDLDFLNAETLGLQLVHTLVQQLEGDIKLDKGDETEIKIVFSEPS